MTIDINPKYRAGDVLEYQDDKETKISKVVRVLFKGEVFDARIGSATCVYEYVFPETWVSESDIICRYVKEVEE